MENIIDCIEIEKLQRVKFKEARVIPGDDHSPFYLEVTYEFENPSGIFELHLPKVEMCSFFKENALPNLKINVPDITDYYYNKRCEEDYSYCSTLYSSCISRPFIAPFNSIIRELYLSTDMDFEIIPIKEKVHDMTLKDIEKELGYKVNIIS